MPIVSRKRPKADSRPDSTSPKAFEELVSAHLDALYRTAHRLCAGNSADAEDLLQDAMLRALEHYSELRSAAAARSWLFTIVVRTNLNRLRSRKRRGERVMSDLGEQELEAALEAWQPAEPVDERIERLDLRKRLTDSLDELDDELREVIWLADVEGFRHAELAEMLGLPEGTVASRLFRARHALRNALHDRTRASRARGAP